MTESHQQSAMRSVIVVLGLLSAALSLWSSTALAGQARVYLEKKVVTLPLVKISDTEYVSLESVANAAGESLRRLSIPGRYDIPLGNFALTVAIGSPVVRIGKTVVILSSPPKRSGGKVLVPLELLPIALGARYGENRLNWDSEARVARILNHAYSLRALRFRSYQDHTRVVLEGSRPHDFIVNEDGASGRVVLDVKQGVMSPSIQSSQVSDGLVASIETQQIGHDSRITIHGAGRRLWSKVFAIGEPDRIVIDLFSGKEQVRQLRQTEAETKVTLGGSDQPTLLNRGVEPTDLPLPVGSLPGQKVRIVVIDPGHGGRDSGAIGPSGVKEKDIVLDIGLRLKRLIEKDLDMKVVLTRTEDIFVPLESRTMMANRHRADFFISLHVNAAPESRAVGFETYFLSREPSDRGARASAVRENTVLNLEGVSQGAHRGLKTVLWDLTQTFFVKESSELAELLLNELGQRLRIDNRGIKSAPFFVLTGAAMPSVLVEVAFITNPDEEQRLEQEAYRQQVAEALLAGIAKFKSRYEKRVELTPARSALSNQYQQ